MFNATCKLLFLIPSQRSTLQQFGDTGSDKLEFFSGVYNSEIGSGENFYVEERAQNAKFRNQHKKAVFRKCGEEWTFSFQEGPCESTWEMKSEGTPSYDILISPGLSWFFKDHVGRKLPIQLFNLMNNDCIFDNICSDNGVCNKITRLCACNAGWNGFSCEFDETCPIISIDSSKQIIPTPNRLLDFGR